VALTRRQFLAGAAAFPAVQCAGWQRVRRADDLQFAACLVSSWESSALQREWLAGYQDALASLALPCNVIRPGGACRARLVIFPAADLSEAADCRWIKALAARGSTVLVETAAAFLPVQAQERQAALAESHLGIRLHPARSLWSEGAETAGLPYVDLAWPVQARVRDYSRVIGVSGGEGIPLAAVEGLPCGARKRIGAGTLLFLGSPVGPHLRAKDREALHWFRSLCSSRSLG
jgi:hypothetical protein